MITPNLPFGDAELEAAKRLLPELEAHLNLISSVSNLMAQVASAVPPEPLSSTSQSRRVTATLLSRLSNDLRSIGVLALHGYSLQAASVAANAYETAYTIAAVSGDDDAASRWIQHEDPTHEFMPVLEATKLALKKIGHPDADGQAQVEYRVYRQLCMAKHANPVGNATLRARRCSRC